MGGWGGGGGVWGVGGGGGGGAGEVGEEGEVGERLIFSDWKIMYILNVAFVYNYYVRFARWSRKCHERAANEASLSLSLTDVVPSPAGRGRARDRARDRLLARARADGPQRVRHDSREERSFVEPQQLRRGRPRPDQPAPRRDVRRRLRDALLANGNPYPAHPVPRTPYSIHVDSRFCCNYYY